MPAKKTANAQRINEGKGGARTGAGRRAGGMNARQKDLDLYAKARAKKEVFLANKAEAEFRKLQCELYDRAEVRQTVAVTLSTLVEQLRSVPDMLERNAALTPVQIGMVADAIDTQLDEARKKLQGLVE